MISLSNLVPSRRLACNRKTHQNYRKLSQNQTTMTATADTSNQDNSGEDQVLSYQPLAENSAVSANPHIPSVTASAVLGESESVSALCLQID